MPLPYDSNGNFSLVAGYLAVSGQTILASQHNPPFEDVASGMSQVLLRSGAAPMTGNLSAAGFKITNAAEGSADGDYVTKAQLDAVAVDITAAAPTGTVLGFRRTSAPTGWVKENGGTIGNAASGGTTRANSDTLELFTVLWDQFSNTILPIQTSAGAASTRGVSAAADFAANKRMPLFDSRSRFHRGADDGLGFDATLTVGATQADALKTHTHTGTATAGGAHNHNLSIGNDSTGPGSVVYGSASAVAGIAAPGLVATGDHTHPLAVDATGDALETRPRSSVVLICIKL